MARSALRCVWGKGVRVRFRSCFVGVCALLTQRWWSGGVGFCSVRWEMASLPPHRRRRHFRSWGSRTASAGRADFGGSLPEFPRWLSWANVELRLAEAVARSVSEVSCRGCRRVTGCETNDWGYTLAETLMDVEEKKKRRTTECLVRVQDDVPSACLSHYRFPLWSLTGDLKTGVPVAYWWFGDGRSVTQILGKEFDPVYAVFWERTAAGCSHPTGSERGLGRVSITRFRLRKFVRQFVRIDARVRRAGYGCLPSLNEDGRCVRNVPLTAGESWMLKSIFGRGR